MTSPSTEVTHTTRRLCPAHQPTLSAPQTLSQLLNSTSTILLDLHSEPDTSPQPDTHTSQPIIHDMDHPLSTTTPTVEPFQPPTAVDPYQPPSPTVDTSLPHSLTADTSLPHSPTATADTSLPHSPTVDTSLPHSPTATADPSLPHSPTVEPSQPPSPHRDNRSEEPTTTSQPPNKRQRRTTSRSDIEQFHTDYAQVLSIFTGTGSRTNAIKDARISKSTFYHNKAITELHIVKPEVFQQEVHSAITDNLQLSEFSLRCKEVLVSYKDELKALKKAKKIF